MIWDLKKNI